MPPARVVERTGVLHRVIDAFQLAFKSLGREAPPQRLEQLATLVHTLMSQEGRFYHTTEHVFDLFPSVPAEKPLIVLAALFHDVIYTQIDAGLPSTIEPLLRNVVELNSDKQYVLLTPSGDDADVITLAAIVFDFKAGQALPMFCGLNEFLSCTLAMLSLKGLVSMKSLLLIAVAIESTIPFRQEKDGKSWCQLLAQRARAAADRLNITVTTEEIDAAVGDAVDMANRDVGGFGAVDVRDFLINTWNLMPESNPFLRHPGIFTLHQYRTSLLKPYRFLTGLSPTRIFHQYNGVPSDAHVTLLRQRAARNLNIAKYYMQTKLVVSGIIEAIAELTGGDGPVSLFLGGQEGTRLDNFLPSYMPLCSAEQEAQFESDGELCTVVASLLHHGRSDRQKGHTPSSAFDLEHSPTASFLFSRVKLEGLQDVWPKAEQFFDEKLSSKEFLQALPSDVVKPICTAMASLVKTRYTALQDLVKETL